MNRITRTLPMVLLLVGAITALPAFAQTKQTPRQALAEGQLNLLTQAQQTLAEAQASGAATNAKTLFDDAGWRVRFAQENWNASKSETRDQARLRAEEALWAARAALAKARWANTNDAIRSLQLDINRFGGSSNVSVVDEPGDRVFSRGTSSKARIDYAQSVIDEAKAAGADRIEGNDLKPAQENLSTARKIIRGDATSESADHLAFVAEMMARRAYYIVRASESTKYLPDLQLQRTRFAQQASEQQAAAERAQRQAAEQQAAQLQQQLAREQANRQAQAAEVDRLRQQVEANRRGMQARITADREARRAAEQALDATMAKYEAGIATGNAADVDALRRQVEDQQIALRGVQQREELDERAMSAEIEQLRADLATAQQNGSMNTDVLAQRQSDLTRRQADYEAYRADRAQIMAHRQELDAQAQARITAAQQRRQDADAQAEAMRQQIAAAQQQAADAQQQASNAQQQASDAQQQADQLKNQLQQTQQQSQQQLDEQRQALEQQKKQAADQLEQQQRQTRSELDQQKQMTQKQLDEQKQQTQQQLDQQRRDAARQVDQQSQQTRETQAALDQAKQQAAETQSELERTRLRLAQRDAEARRLQMQAELNHFAPTRSAERGLIVTLPGIFFDSGKSVLKPGAKNTLTKIANRLKNEASVKIAVEGHTDNVGSKESNQTLSEKRANAVRDFLVSGGIPADRISASGKGESEPVATNKTAAGRQQNRRVELVITTE